MILAVMSRPPLDHLGACYRRLLALRQNLLAPPIASAHISHLDER